MMEDGGDSAIFSTPTCVQLGIPIPDCPGGMYPLRDPHHTSHQGEPLSPFPLPNYIDPRYAGSFMNPYGHGYLPLPNPYGFYDLEPSFIRRRNERERERVRNVNEGYARLREHLPSENSEKRMSKVETLRLAIKYIKELQEVLNNGEHGKENHPARDGDADDKESGYQSNEGEK